MLHLLGTVGHLGLLVQNNDGHWQYFSMNGTWIYDSTNGAAGGKPYHDLGKKTFASPEDFLNSDYNRTGTKEEIEKDKVNGYGYEEAYILPTSSKQDSKIREAFKKSAKKGYNLLTNQCAQVVQSSLKAAGINLFDEKFSMHIGGQRVTIPSNPYFPQSTFSQLLKRYKGLLIYKNENK